LSTTPILTFSIEGKEFIAYSDASEKGLGYALMQDDKIIADACL